MDSTDANQLCLECGLCCNGVIFADGQLQPVDDVEHLRSLGLALKRPTKSGEVKFRQPCAAFDGCRCRIYADRPRYCREFECLLFKRVAEGEGELAAGLKTIRAARRRVDKVKRLLRRLGDADEKAALSVRFRRMQRRFERGIPDAESADHYGQLTLAVHDLHLLLGESFYPG
ncbi:MAG TPA: YkgJ family cysteine cluster protein [Candidatus Paceibacterota bacterium]|nr:YkgJ family cysteine cluster protein [Candidatus Paceibacterota bacterium]